MKFNFSMSEILESTLFELHKCNWHQNLQNSICHSIFVHLVRLAGSRWILLNSLTFEILCCYIVPHGIWFVDHLGVIVLIFANYNLHHTPFWIFFMMEIHNFWLPNSRQALLHYFQMQPEMAYKNLNPVIPKFQILFSIDKSIANIILTDKSISKYIYSIKNKI